MRDYNCDLCNRSTIYSGKDTLLYEDKYCYIVENGNTDGYTRRISLTINSHSPGGDMTDRIAAHVLSMYMEIDLGIHDYIIRKTMKTYPNHFHLHAYVLPKLEEPES